MKSRYRDSSARSCQFAAGLGGAMTDLIDAVAEQGSHNSARNRPRREIGRGPVLSPGRQPGRTKPSPRTVSRRCGVHHSPRRHSLTAASSSTCQPAVLSPRLLGGVGMTPLLLPPAIPILRPGEATLAALLGWMTIKLVCGILLRLYDKRWVP